MGFIGRHEVDWIVESSWAEVEDDSDFDAS